MIKSMTGFARAEQTISQGQLIWEVRSVNHRYLEIQLRFPEGLRSVEPRLREAVNQRLRRGKVDATLYFHPSAGSGQSLNLNLELARKLIMHAENLAKEIPTPAPISPLAVLRWPGVLGEAGTDTETLAKPATELLERVVDTLCESRAKEGKRLCEILERRLAEGTCLVTDVRKRMPDILTQIRARLEERAKSLAMRLDPERLEQEMLLLAQRLDVEEELDRLDAHIAEIRDSLAAGSPAGRRLDFLMQEMNREANTLASKSADATTARDAVDLKVLIEQMREQIQNVE